MKAVQIRDNFVLLRYVGFKLLGEDNRVEKR
jgi:hypothetical protein